jgi:8-oxo-dGTP pyrophosphatase MutT (NUDIX family)
MYHQPGVPEPEKHRDQSVPVTDPDQGMDRSPEIDIVAEITVATATAIVTHPDNPYLVLVADSEKHPLPVIPGGKIEIDDPIADGETPGLECVLREVGEEIKAELQNARYIGKANDPERDVRVVLPEKVAGTLTDPPFSSIDFSECHPETARIKAHYGTPDYIYVGSVDPERIQNTEELENVRFIDIRELEVGQLSAGHDVIVLKYRQMLESGAERLDDAALSDFDQARVDLLG